MQKALLFLGLVLMTSSLLAQNCSDLFISEYVEGYANNKALEIYNPTGSAINLSGYSVVRYSNGNTTPGSDVIQPLPDMMLESNDVFVVVLDKQDVANWNSQFEKPVWNGYNVIDTLRDDVTNEPITDSLGNAIVGPQYEDGSAIFGDEYDEQYDLQCKADAFLCPVYNDNNAMYFNGNDAVVLISGSTIEPDGSNVIDVIGVIGEDPEATIMEDAWVDDNGFWLTKDRTLVRKASVDAGRNDPNDVVYQLNGTFNGDEWNSYPKNSFQYLGIHNSVCNSSTKPDEFSCVTGVFTNELNAIPFTMYPNPLSTSALTVEAPENIEGVTVYNLMGQQVFAQDLGGASTKVEINLNQIEGGMYLINILFADNQVSIQKLIVE